MKHYEHISKMETIMNDHSRMLAQLNDLLDRLEAHQQERQELIAYYYSDQRRQDLEDDNQDLIPKTMHRGVLSEDEIYNLMSEDYETGIRMIELALKFIRND